MYKELSIVCSRKAGICGIHYIVGDACCCHCDFVEDCEAKCNILNLCNNDGVIVSNTCFSAKTISRKVILKD